MLREYQEEIKKLKAMLQNPQAMKELVSSPSPNKAQRKKSDNSNFEGSYNEYNKKHDSGEKRI